MIRKIKYKNDTVEIHEELESGGTKKEVVFKCTDKPHLDFVNVWPNLEAPVRQIIEITRETWVGQVAIDGVSFSESEGVVISGRIELVGSASPFCFNTPHVKVADLPAPQREHLHRLMTEAVAYMNGSKRAQLELPGVK